MALAFSIALSLSALRCSVAQGAQVSDDTAIVQPVSVLAPAPAPSELSQEVSNNGSSTAPRLQNLFSIRDYYFNFGSGEFHDDVVFRIDHKLSKAWTLAAEFTLATAYFDNHHYNGTGDSFLQALYTAMHTKHFAIAAGGAAILPTASAGNLGAGKFMLAPVVTPTIYPLETERLAASLQLRNFVSVANVGKANFVSVGGDAPFSAAEGGEVNFLEIKPSIKYSVSERWELYAEPVSMVADWQAGGEMSYRSAIRVTGMITDRVGLWLQPEIPFGSNRTGPFNVKVSLFYKY